MDWEAIHWIGEQVTIGSGPYAGQSGVVVGSGMAFGVRGAALWYAVRIPGHGTVTVDECETANPVRKWILV